MMQWLIIGLVIWYFYSRFKKRQAREIENRTRYIRDDDFRKDDHSPASGSVQDDEYIDYEEVR